MIQRLLRKVNRKNLPAGGSFHQGGEELCFAGGCRGRPVQSPLRETPRQAQLASPPWWKILPLGRRQKLARRAAAPEAKLRAFVPLCEAKIRCALRGENSPNPSLQKQAQETLRVQRVEILAYILAGKRGHYVVAIQITAGKPRRKIGRVAV